MLPHSCFKAWIILIILLGLANASNSQEVKDTTLSFQLPTIEITEFLNPDVQPIDYAIKGLNVSGKKTEFVNLKTSSFILAEKTGRQIFSKIPGIIVYDMDGAGNQINIARRGLDPHRGWEFNVRKDGIMLNSDIYAYPASHYSIPLESVERIEMTTGTSSLQYGAQFGGLIHYVSKGADTTKAVAFENISAIGSFGLVSTYNSLGGTIGKFRYFAFLSSRKRDGYRDGEASENRAHLVRLEYLFSHKLRAQLEWTQSMYQFKSPGPLTDSMFIANPRQGTRTRNYYSPTISIPSLKITYTPSPRTSVQLVASRLYGDRSSVMFYLPATIADTINTNINNFNPRQVDIDLFDSYTTEIKLDHTFQIFKKNQRLVAGVQVLSNELTRRQNGIGTSGSDYDLSIVPNSWRRDISMTSRNLAVYGENTTYISKKIKFNLGFRYEQGVSTLGGNIVNIPTEQTNFDLNRQFLLLSSSISYKATKKSEVYGAISQNYRPVILRDLTPADAFELIDPELKDAIGYNAEIGFRGSFHHFSWDVNAYILQYNNRVGIVPLEDNATTFTTLRTNTGDSRAIGSEALLQLYLPLNEKIRLHLFTSSSFAFAEYVSGVVRAGSNAIDISGNRIEGVPKIMSTNGVQIQMKKLIFGFQVNYVGENFADPRNTIEPSATGGVGIVPEFTIVDATFRWEINRFVSVNAVLNNIFDRQYFTKRPLIYPGPGVWPSDGRNASLAVNVRI